MQDINISLLNVKNSKNDCNSVCLDNKKDIDTNKFRKMFEIANKNICKNEIELDDEHCLDDDVTKKDLIEQVDGIQELMQIILCKIFNADDIEKFNDEIKDFETNFKNTIHSIKSNIEKCNLESLDEEIKYVSFKLSNIIKELQSVFKKYDNISQETIKQDCNNILSKNNVNILKSVNEELDKINYYLNSKVEIKKPRSILLHTFNVEELNKKDEQNIGNQKDIEVEKLDDDSDCINLQKIAAKSNKETNKETNEENHFSNNELQFNHLDKINISNRIKGRTLIKDDMNFIEIDKYHVDKNELMNQIIDKAKVILKQNNPEMRIKLKPEILGELMFKVQVEEGNVIAKAIVDNYTTKQIIESNLYQLKEGLQEQGLNIKTFEINVGYDNNKSFQRENQNNYNFKQKNKRIKNRKIDLNKNYERTSIEKESLPLIGENTLDLMV